jgi:molecular chaperone GrpE
MTDERMLDLDAEEEKAEDSGSPRRKKKDEEPESRLRVIDRRFWARKESESGGEAEEKDAPRLDVAAPYVEELKDEAARWKKESGEMEKRLKELSALYQELQFDMERMRSRSERDLERRIRRAKADFFKEILPVLDSFGRALGSENAQSSQDAGTVYRGMRMICSQLEAFLLGAGLEKFSPLGEVFDPVTSEALEVAPVTDASQDNRVLAVLTDGYRFEGELLRPAQVRVGKTSRPARSEEPPSGGENREIQVRDGGEKEAS